MGAISAHELMEQARKYRELADQFETLGRSILNGSALKSGAGSVGKPRTKAVNTGRSNRSRQILECLREAGQPLTFQQIVRRTRMPKGSFHAARNRLESVVHIGRGLYGIRDGAAAATEEPK